MQSSLIWEEESKQLGMRPMGRLEVETILHRLQGGFIINKAETAQLLGAIDPAITFAPPQVTTEKRPAEQSKRGESS